MNLLLLGDCDRQILEAVDEYSLYCFYTGIDNLVIGQTYISPIRLEADPSFVVFESSKYENVEFMWKDHGGDSGSIFTLIQRLFGLQSRSQAYSKIIDDFQLDFSGVEYSIGEKKVSVVRKKVDPTKIRISSIPFSMKGKDYWDQLGITDTILNYYHTSQIQYYWTKIGQVAPTHAVDPMFAYRVGAYYQLYVPGIYGHKKMFRQDLPPNYFLGYIQLPKTGDILIIDKSMKDLMFCRAIGYWAVSGKSETTIIPGGKMEELRRRFKRIFLMLDPDKAGLEQTDKYLSLYPWLIPRFLKEAKDKTDLCMKVGFDEAKKIINEIILQ